MLKNLILKMLNIGRRNKTIAEKFFSAIFLEINGFQILIYSISMLLLKFVTKNDKKSSIDLQLRI